MKIAKAIVALIVLSVFPCHAELIVIAHPDAPITSLSKEEVARIFLKKRRTFPNGDEIVPLSQPDFPEKDDEFFFRISEKKRIQLNAYWARLLFTGKGRPPLNGKNDQQILQSVAQNPKFVGYIDASSLNDSVKVIYRLKN